MEGELVVRREGWEVVVLVNTTDQWSFNGSYKLF